MLSEKPDILIIGAGVIGSALAMALAQKGAKNIFVIDPDLEGSFSSSELNAGGVRATFSQKINVLSSQISIDYFSQVADLVGFRPVGYLWLYSEEKIHSSLARREMWDQLGWRTEFWSVEKIRKERSFIDRIEGLAGGVFSPRDGLINSNLLKQHYRKEATRLGVQFVDRSFLIQAQWSTRHWELEVGTLPKKWDELEKEEFFIGKAGTTQKRVSVSKIRSRVVVNCAGPWASQVASLLNYDVPSFPSRRQVSFFDVQGLDLSSFGMTVDTSGVYFHPEATRILAGVNMNQEPHRYCFQYDGDDFFQEQIWYPLSQRSSYFENLKHITGWAGLYEISPDESAIVGEVELSSSMSGHLYESHSYSGHGVMHSYANAQALAQKILHGHYSSDLDLSSLSGSRFKKKQLVLESEVI